MPHDNSRRQRNVILGPEVDALVDAQAARDGVTFTQAIQRAVKTREEILAMARAPSRLAHVRNPDLVLPLGVEVIRFAGEY